MKPYNLTLLLMTAAALLSSCTTGFTHRTRLKISESDVDIERVQFYTNKKIVLRRDVRRDERVRTTKGGKLTVENGRVVETVRIGRKTPGVCTAVTDTTLILRVGESESSVLQFRREGDDYVLDRGTASKNQVLFESRTYEVLRGAECALRIKRSDDFDTRRSRRRVRGLRLATE
ncbi:MAG: hypothetical protein GF344_16595 [Chitinivibrionales bacterium]|nr:hypothetical protein [Chitinivibrionales bacterium]MBD3358310.1 hypothetical protein [Chitinivibrionales bacterium]